MSALFKANKLVALGFLLCFAQTINGQPEHVIYPRRVTGWGRWHDWSYCPNGTYVVGMRLKIEGSQRKGDDTALNGIELLCVDKQDNIVQTISSGVQRWGEWGNRFHCETGLMKGFRLRAEAHCGKCDDTAANNVIMLCTNGRSIEGDGMGWGDWSAPATCLPGHAVCGLRTQIEDPQGKGDDTALNNVDMLCCKINKDCIPTDSFGASKVFDNRNAVSSTMFIYELQEGVTRTRETAIGYAQSETRSESVSVSAGLFADLTATFSANLGFSRTTGYDWRKSEANTWSTLHRVSISIEAPPGKMVTVDQVIGRCGDELVFTRVFRRVDS